MNVRERLQDTRSIYTTKLPRVVTFLGYYEGGRKYANRTLRLSIYNDKKMLLYRYLENLGPFTPSKTITKYYSFSLRLRNLHLFWVLIVFLCGSLCTKFI